MVYGRHSRMGWTPVASGIAGSISGTPTGTITDFYVSYQQATGGGWTRVTPSTLVPVGSLCQFQCSISANSGGGTSWSTVVTVIDLFDGKLFQYHLATLGSLGVGGNVNDVYNDAVMGGIAGSPWTMPSHDLQLSWHLFASFDATANKTLLNAGDPSLYY